jgi:hypothetical protein
MTENGFYVIYAQHRGAYVPGFVRMTSVNMMEGVNEPTEGDDLLVPHPRRARNCVHIGNPGLIDSRIFFSAPDRLHPS